MHEFAQLAGVTVRALHHYDRLGLLRPKRAGSGYRLYGIRDLERLEQIVALKFLGIPLKQIKSILERDARELPEVLRSQRQALEEKRRWLDHAISAIQDAERSVVPGKQADAALLIRGCRRKLNWRNAGRTGLLNLPGTVRNGVRCESEPVGGEGVLSKTNTSATGYRSWRADASNAARYAN